MNGKSKFRGPIKVALQKSKIFARVREKLARICALKITALFDRSSIYDFIAEFFSKKYFKAFSPIFLQHDAISKATIQFPKEAQIGKI